MSMMVTVTAGGQLFGSELHLGTARAATDGPEQLRRVSKSLSSQFGGRITCADGSPDGGSRRDGALCAGRLGIRSKGTKKDAERLPITVRSLCTLTHFYNDAVGVGYGVDIIVYRSKGRIFPILLASCVVERMSIETSDCEPILVCATRFCRSQSLRSLSWSSLLEHEPIHGGSE